MKKIIVFILASFLSLNAQSDLTTIKEEIEKGNFSAALNIINNEMSRPGLTESEKYDLEFERDKMERIRLDFNKSLEDILPYIKKYYPEVNDQLISEWEKDNSLEHKVIDGRKRYFSRSASNLFLINKKARERKKQITGPVSDKLDEFLAKEVPAVVKRSINENKTLMNPVRFKLTYTVSVDPNAVPDGEVIRCWLPFPREGNKRQSDIKLISASQENYIIAGNEYPQRTLYMEKKAVKDQKTEFKMELGYTAFSEWFNIDPENVKEYNKDSQTYKSFTSERAPHIVFTKEIKELSSEILGNETNPYLKARRIFEWISNNIPWAGAREYSTLENIPSYCISNKHGDCGIKTLLFITLARYNGIPARWQSGWMLHPVEVNLHDWGEAYFEGYGWVPVDQSFGLQESADPNVKYFFLGGMDSYRFIVNDDYGQPLFPAKIYPRSETVDFQRGELEWRGGNLYFNKWDYNMEVEYENQQP